MRLFQWHKPRVVERGGARAADIGCKLVEREALGAGEPKFTAMYGGAPNLAAMYGGASSPGVPNRREQQQLAGGAGVEVAARRFVSGREAVGLERDERQALFHRGASNLLFAGAYAGRDKNRSALGGVEETGLLGGERFGRDSARALDLEPVGSVEQKWVAVCGVGRAGERQGVDASEIIGVGAAYRQPAGVVANIAKESFELAFVGENAVVVAGREEGGSRHVWRATEPWRLVWCRAIDGSICLGTANLEASNHFAQVSGHSAANEYEPVEVVGHHSKFKKLNFGMVAGNLSPAIGDGLAQRRKSDAFAREMPENRSATIDFKSNHVYAAIIVVVAEASALHGMNHWAFHTAHIIRNNRNSCKEAA